MRRWESWQVAVFGEWAHPWKASLVLFVLVRGVCPQSVSLEEELLERSLTSYQGDCPWTLCESKSCCCCAAR